MLSRCFFGFFCGFMGVCHRTESDLFLFVFQCNFWGLRDHYFDKKQVKCHSSSVEMHSKCHPTSIQL